MKFDSREVSEGVDAYSAGIPRSLCPYEPESSENLDWLHGWDKAEEIDLERIGSALLKSP